MNLLFVRVNDYDYNNTGQFKTYYKLPKRDTMDFWNGKNFPDWELDILESEGNAIQVIKTIDLHAE